MHCIKILLHHDAAKCIATCLTSLHLTTHDASTFLSFPTLHSASPTHSPGFHCTADTSLRAQKEKTYGQRERGKMDRGMHRKKEGRGGEEWGGKLNKGSRSEEVRWGWWRGRERMWGQREDKELTYTVQYSPRRCRLSAAARWGSILIWSNVTQLPGWWRGTAEWMSQELLYITLNNSIQTLYFMQTPVSWTVIIMQGQTYLIVLWAHN